MSHSIWQGRLTDYGMAKMLGVSVALWKLYRTHPERFPEPEPKMIKSAMSLSRKLHRAAHKYLDGTISNEEFMRQVIEYQSKFQPEHNRDHAK